MPSNKVSSVKKAQQSNTKNSLKVSHKGLMSTNRNKMPSNKNKVSSVKKAQQFNAKNSLKVSHKGLMSRKRNKKELKKIQKLPIRSNAKQSTRTGSEKKRTAMTSSSVMKISTDHAHTTSMRKKITSNKNKISMAVSNKSQGMKKSLKKYMNRKEESKKKMITVGAIKDFSHKNKLIKLPKKKNMNRKEKSKKKVITTAIKKNDLQKNKSIKLLKEYPSIKKNTAAILTNSSRRLRKDAKKSKTSQKMISSTNKKGYKKSITSISQKSSTKRRTQKMISSANKKGYKNNVTPLPSKITKSVKKNTNSLKDISSKKVIPALKKNLGTMINLIIPKVMGNKKISNEKKENRNKTLNVQTIKKNKKIGSSSQSTDGTSNLLSVDAVEVTNKKIKGDTILVTGTKIDEEEEISEMSKKSKNSKSSKNGKKSKGDGFDEISETSTKTGPVSKEVSSESSSSSNKKKIIKKKDKKKSSLIIPAPKLNSSWNGVMWIDDIVHTSSATSSLPSKFAKITKVSSVKSCATVNGFGIGPVILERAKPITVAVQRGSNTFLIENLNSRSTIGDVKRKIMKNYNHPTDHQVLYLLNKRQTELSDFSRLDRVYCLQNGGNAYTKSFVEKDEESDTTRPVIFLEFEIFTWKLWINYGFQKDCRFRCNGTTPMNDLYDFASKSFGISRDDMLLFTENGQQLERDGIVENGCMSSGDRIRCVYA